MLAYLLAHEGHTVATAATGEEALEKASEFAPDVAILDIGMPGLNGYDLARLLREQQSGSRIFLIALTGLGRAEDKARAAQSGFDHHFTKPVDLDSLLTLLGARVGRDSHQGGS